MGILWRQSGHSWAGLRVLWRHVAKWQHACRHLDGWSLLALRCCCCHWRGGLLQQEGSLAAHSSRIPQLGRQLVHL